jgi:hypothetical protein
MSFGTKKVGWVDQALNYIEDFKPKYKIKLNWFWLSTFFTAFWFAVKFRGQLRHLTPKPLDVFNHVGNLDSTAIALIVVGIVCALLARWTSLSRQSLKKVIILLTLIVCIGVNTFVETPPGMRYLNLPNTGDILDVIWPTILGLALTLSCLRIVKRD